MTSTLPKVQHPCGCPPVEECKACDKPKAKHCCTDYYRHIEIEYVDYDEWLPNLSLFTDNTDESILYDYIRRACIEFSTQTNILVRKIELSPEDCVGDYYPCLGEEERISRLKELSVDGSFYNATPYTDFHSMRGRSYWFRPESALEIHPAPKSTSEVNLVVQAAPRETSTKVDRIIYDRYFETIVNGAMKHLHLIPNTTFTNRGMYEVRRQAFEEGVTQAKIDLFRTFSSGVSNGRGFNSKLNLNGGVNCGDC